MDSQQIFFNLNPVNFLIISGLLQNLFLAAVLIFRPGDQQKGNRLIGLTVLIVAMHLMYLMVVDTNLDNLYPHLLWIPYSFLTAIGPLIFLYTKTITRTFDTSSKPARHFMPVMFEFVLQVIMIGYAATHDQLFYNTPFYFYITPLIYLCAVISIIYYLRKSLLIIADHEMSSLEQYSNLKEVTLNWLRKLIVYYRLLWIVWIPFVTLFLLFFRFQLQYLVIVLLLYILLLAITYLTVWISIETIGRGNFVVLSPITSKSESKNYSKLAEQDISNYRAIISEFMTVEKPYLNENLSLKDLAAQLELDPNLLSYLLNNHLQKNFHDFINEFRIEEVKKKLNDPEFRHFSLLGIALESGFNSKTTFNRVFKRLTGMTPGEFQKRRA